MDWKSFLRQVLDFLFKTGLARFLTGLVASGVGLLSVAWTDIAAALIGVVFRPDKPESAVGIAQIVGICLIVVGIVGRILLEVVTTRRERRRLAMDLIGRLRHLVDGFQDPDVRRESDYYNNEIVQCVQAAKDFHKVAPEKFSANEVLAGIRSPKFDASKKEPFFQPTLDEVRELIAKLEVHYGVERS